MRWKEIVLGVVFIWLRLVIGQEDIAVDDVTETAPDDVTTANIYDIIINDRDSNDIIVNEDITETPPTDDNNDDEEHDISKLLAAQVHAIEVFNMIKDLETEMKVKDMIEMFTLHCLYLLLGAYCKQNRRNTN